MVVLEHTRAGERTHFDWLIDPDGFSPLIAFRTYTDPVAGPPEFECERASDHRRVYLEFEGELSGGRGCVRRLAACAIDSIVASDSTIEVSVACDAVRYGWRIERVIGDAWISRRTSLSCTGVLAIP